MSGSYLHLVLRGIVFEGDRWTFCFLLVLKIYDIRSLHSGKVQHFFLNQTTLQKSMPDQILSGDLAGPGGNCGNTMVAQSVGILLMWYLQSWTWPLKAIQWEAVLSILWKLPSPAAAGRSPMGWKLVWLWRFEISTCPMNVLAFTCIWICCSEKYGDASKAQPPSPGWRGKPAWCRWMWPAPCWGGEAVWLLSQALH